jgi:glycosyltransferase involved in cell wall biosynthesis
MAAGIDLARGKILVTMDGDLQNDPEDIPRFIEKIEEGFDIVCGWREKRQDKLITRKIPSIVANWLIGKVTGVPIRDNGCSLKAYRSEVIKAIPLYSEMHRFIPAMASIAGSRIAQIPVRHHARKFGKSKYGLSRIYKVLLDLLMIKTVVSFSSRPMLWFGSMASITALGSLLTFVYSIAWLNRHEGGSLVVLIGTAMLFGALTIFFLFAGAIGELAYKTGNLKMDTLADIRASLTGFERQKNEE